MTTTLVGKYEYSHGARGYNNRQIQFLRAGSNAKSLQARIHSTHKDGVGIGIELIPGERIIVEGESTTEQVDRLFTRKLFPENEYNDRYKPKQPDQKLSDLSIAEQDKIIGSLSPYWDRHETYKAPSTALKHIEVLLGALVAGHENVIGLKIFDPS